jgi:hypothetical protein
VAVRARQIRRQHHRSDAERNQPAHFEQLFQTTSSICKVTSRTTTSGGFSRACVTAVDRLQAPQKGTALHFAMRSTFGWRLRNGRWLCGNDVEVMSQLGGTNAHLPPGGSRSIRLRPRSTPAPAAASGPAADQSTFAVINHPTARASVCDSLAASSPMDRATGAHHGPPGLHCDHDADHSWTFFKMMALEALQSKR